MMCINIQGFKRALKSLRRQNWRTSKLLTRISFLSSYPANLTISLLIRSLDEIFSNDDCIGFVHNSVDYVRLNDQQFINHLLNNRYTTENPRQAGFFAIGSKSEGNHYAYILSTQNSYPIIEYYRYHHRGNQKCYTHFPTIQLFNDDINFLPPDEPRYNVR